MHRIQLPQDCYILDSTTLSKSETNTISPIVLGQREDLVNIGHQEFIMITRQKKHIRMMTLVRNVVIHQHSYNRTTGIVHHIL